MLSEILCKYSVTHHIIILGDFNSSLIRDKPQDRLLKKFVSEFNLEVPGDIGNTPTYTHYNGVWCSQIDYVLVGSRGITADLKVLSDDPPNTSTHHAIICQVRLQSRIKMVESNPGFAKCVTCLLWDQANHVRMQQAFQSFLPTGLLSHISPPEVEVAAMAVIDALNYAAEAAVPSKIIKLKGPDRKVSPCLLQRLKESRHAYQVWNQVGRPRPDHQSSMAYRQAKRAVRQQQRLEAAEDRREFYNQVMTDVNNVNFHRLIRRQRSTREVSTAIMVSGELCFDPQQQLEAWCSHFERLGMPQDQEDFDDSYLESIHEDLDIISLLIEESTEGQEYSEAEIEGAIGRLNSGKAPDQWNLAAEHLKVAKPVLVPVLHKLLNAIREIKYVPSCLKVGIVTPISKKNKSKQLMDCHRGITITAVLGKVLEQVVLDRMATNQSPLQFVDSQRGYHQVWLHYW
jgi:hypothetical protein